MSADRKRTLYSLSFAMAFAQIGCLLLCFGSAHRTGVFSFQHLNHYWIASGIVGLMCAAVAGGDSKQSTNTAQVFALGLNGSFLLWLWIINMAMYMHD